jgi:hypothetical protein
VRFMFYHCHAPGICSCALRCRVFAVLAWLGLLLVWAGL